MPFPTAQQVNLPACSRQEASRLGSILSRVKPKTSKLVSAVTLAKRSAITCSAEDEMNREYKYVSEFLTKFSPGAKGSQQLKNAIKPHNISFQLSLQG